MKEPGQPRFVLITIHFFFFYEQCLSILQI
nr:MAG TPA: hypothetical protein [Caudoviricetes sp.]